MPNAPSPDLEVTEALIRGLLTAQAPAFAGLPLHHAADGWDCSVWRLGDRLAARIPRREAAAGLIRSEQATLPEIGRLLAGSPLRVPVPVFHGQPGARMPWHWSIVPWIAERPALDVPAEERAGWVRPLAEALTALHVAAPPSAPRNPFRGVPLAARAATISDRLSALEADGEDVRALRAAWRDGCDAALHDGPPLWVHGDLHPGNLVADGSALRGIIDFGDVTSGDPAYDLAVAWLAFGADDRRAFIDALPQHSPDTWRRARGWASAVAAMLLFHSDDAPAYRAVGEHARMQLAAGG